MIALLRKFRADASITKEGSKSAKCNKYAPEPHLNPT
jgi:hypothetical protein